MTGYTIVESTIIQAIEVCIMLGIEETISASIHCFTWNVIGVHGLNSTLHNFHVDTVDVLRYLESTKAHDQKIVGGNYASHRVGYNCPSHIPHQRNLFSSSGSEYLAAIV